MSVIGSKFTSGLVKTTQLGVASGVATLDSTGKLLAAQAPASTFTRFKERFVLASADITNGYVTLSHPALPQSIVAGVQGLGMIEEQTTGSTGDYTTGTYSASTNTKLTWINDLVNTANGTALASGDVIYVQYSY